MILPEDPQELCGYGIFALPPEHPFTPICKMHDTAFSNARAGFPSRSRAENDRALLSGMLGVAKTRQSLRLKLEAYAYYSLARAFGGLFWRGRD